MCIPWTLTNTSLFGDTISLLRHRISLFDILGKFTDKSLYSRCISNFDVFDFPSFLQISLYFPV